MLAPTPPVLTRWAPPTRVHTQVLSYSDVAPGMQLRGTLTSVDEPGGLLVQVAPHVRALVPRLHLPDAGVAGAKGGRTKKFKVRGALRFACLLLPQRALRAALRHAPCGRGSTATQGQQGAKPYSIEGSSTSTASPSTPCAQWRSGLRPA